MAKAAWLGGVGRRLLVPVLGLVVIGVLVLAVRQAPAQADKSTPPAKESPAPPEKEDKVPESKSIPGKPKPPQVVDKFVPGLPGVEQVLLINELLEKQWQENKITPADRCSDYEFIRRASLDIIGRIAKAHELKQFMADPAELRRSRLIERLLNGDECAGNWANLWTILMVTRSGTPKVNRDQMHEWLEDKLTENKKASYVPDWSKIVTEILTAQGRTNENGAVNFILAHLGERIAQDQSANGTFEMVPVTSRSTRLFLGLRTQCVQCHDHPFNGEWGQHHFWGVNAFFRQTDAPNGRPTMVVNKKKGMAGVQQFSLVDKSNLNAKGIVPYERRSGVLLYTDPTFLDGQKPDASSGTSRRAELAKFITGSPYFAKAYVNRIWTHFFGRSFTKDAPDDFGEHNPPSNPELLDGLSLAWAKKYDHDPKVLVRRICNSRAYGLSSVANKTNEKPEDEAFFARMLLKGMTPEQLFESLMVATNAKVGQSKEAREGLKREWLNKLIVNFGNDEGEEGSFNGTVVQALMLMNGQDINQAIMDQKEGTVATVLQKRGASPTGARDAVKDLFLAALNRPPTDKEMKKIMDKNTYVLPRVPPGRDQAAFWTGYYQDVFWAILNSNEFILNH